MSCALLMCALPTLGMAQDICADVTALIPMAQTNFADSTPAIAGAETCRTALALTGAKSLHCAWGFDYRDDRASQTFVAFDAALSGCFAGTTAPSTDKDVNHPDTYDLRQYQIGDVVVSVSLKDKGALQRTFVFVGIQGASLN